MGAPSAHLGMPPPACPPIADQRRAWSRSAIRSSASSNPTPGGSGIAEIAFSGFFRDLLPAVGYIGAIAVIWRLLSYYLYLFMGTVILPRWLRRTKGNVTA